MKDWSLTSVVAGTAGCLLAHRLAHAAARPLVLLVEAGSKAEGDEVRHPANRYIVPIVRPDLDYAYPSTAQEHLNGRTIVYERGRGLGGSTLLNYGVYLYGSREDYNRWADAVGDETWRWENTQESFKQIENYDFSRAITSYPEFAKPRPQDHGTSGQVKVCLPPSLERGTVEMMAAFMGTEDTVNLDLNSGNPVGIGILPNSASEDGRTTSATAHLEDTPDNLVVWTSAVVHGLRFDNDTVVGVETADGRIGKDAWLIFEHLLTESATCTKDVILCGGSIDTPRLLLLNGIGPSAELEALDIQVFKDLPGVGKNLADHLVVFASCEVDGSLNDRCIFEGDEATVAEAKAQWTKDKSGAYTTYGSELWGGFLKLPQLQDYEEFKALPSEEQEFMNREAVPTYEMAANPGCWPPGAVLSAGNTYLTATVYMMNTQSRGSIALRSRDPKDFPLIDLGFFSHPYDRRVLRESYRETWRKVYDNPLVKPKVVRRLFGPESLSDDDIDEFLGENTISVRQKKRNGEDGKSGGSFSVRRLQLQSVWRARTAHRGFERLSSDSQVRWICSYEDELS